MVKNNPNNAMHRMATRVTLPASRFAPEQEARHGQPSVIADDRQK
jgi:hypothetical protein